MQSLSINCSMSQTIRIELPVPCILKRLRLTALGGGSVRNYLGPYLGEQ